MARKTPYTNFHDLNLDWIIKRIKNVYNEDNPPPYPVDSVNGKTGVVVLTGTDIPLSNNDTTPLSRTINQIGQDLSSKYTKPAGGIPASDLAPGAIPDPASIIDDNAGYQAYDKTWSAHKLLQQASELVDVENDVEEINDSITDINNSIQIIQTDTNKLKNDIDNYVIFTETGNQNDFSNNYINTQGKETASQNLALTKRYFNYLQDGLLSIEVPDPYGLYLYVWDRARYLGVLRDNDTISIDGGTVKYNKKINLQDYANYNLKFGLRHNVNGSSVAVNLSEVVNITFKYKRNNVLSGKTISILGDSISSFTGYTSPGSPSAYYPREDARLYHIENMYWKALTIRNGMTIKTIDAYPGATVGDKWQSETRIPFIDDTRIARLNNPDIIIIEGGINDFGGNPLGNYPDIGTYSNTYEFRTAYSLLLNKLKITYPESTIICLSMTSPRNYNNNTFPEKQLTIEQSLAVDQTLHTFEEFNSSIEEIAHRYQCAYCNITDLLNYYISPTSVLGPHWYYNLHMDVAYRIEQLLKNIFA